jgi:phage/plasmid primase-like uncharacterized protein
VTFSFEIAQAKAADILSVAHRHGAQLRKFGGEYAGACPVCGGRDRFSINPKRRIWNCRGCGKGGDVIAFVQHLRALGFLDAVRELAGGKAGPIARGAVEPPEPSTQAPDPTTRTSDAGATWREGVEPRGTAVERYLNSRALELDEALAGEVIRFHRGENAMLALFRDIRSDEPKAISRTFLDPNGVKLGRKFLGPVGGCAIKLDPDEEVVAGLHIGEGIETTMSARQGVRFGDDVVPCRPAWALGSAGAISTFPVLAGIEALTFLRELDKATGKPDAANEKAAATCAIRWQAAKREVRNVWPDSGGDLNDEIMLRRH